jgi:two-component system, NtrC family, sensor histidine kinase HydH
MKTALQPRLIRTGLLLAGLALSVLLGWGSWSVHHGIQGAADVVSQGQGSLLLDEIRDRLHDRMRRGQGPPDVALLKEVLAAHAAQGASYIALVEPDGLWVQAGSPVLDGEAPFVERRGIARIVVLPPAPGFGGPPRGPGPRPGGPKDERGPGTRAGPGGPPPTLIVEFRATMAAQLRGRARTMLGIGLIGALLAALGTLVFWWMLLQREVASEALEEHSRLAALGQMSATMAHEIRNPLTSAKGHAQLLVELLEEGRAKKKAGQVVNELVRLEALTNDLLVFIRSGKLVEASASPLQLLRDAVTQVKGNIEVVDDGAPSDWNLDTSRLDRVLTNILRNAVKAGGPDVKIRARVALEDDHLVYEIRDHGPGIPLDLLATIFDPFVTSRVTGTGLGLAISRQIVEAHNGTIGAHNHPDGGAVITVRLPRT